MKILNFNCFNCKNKLSINYKDDKSVSINKKCKKCNCFRLMYYPSSIFVLNNLYIFVNHKVDNVLYKTKITFYYNNTYCFFNSFSKESNSSFIKEFDINELPDNTEDVLNILEKNFNTYTKYISNLIFE
jgi:hypothetical protein